MRNIVLRKINGRLEALWGSTGVSASVHVPSSSASVMPPGLMRLMLSPLVMAFVLIVAIALMTVLHPSIAAAAPAHSFNGLMVAGMAANVRELRSKRATLVAELRTITDAAETEKRNLSAEEETRYSKLFTDVDELRKTIDREEHLAEAERSLASTTPTPADPDKPEARSDSPRATPEYRNAFASFISRGYRGMRTEEQRALSVGIDSAGGFTVAAEQFVLDLIKGVDNVLWIRQLATKFQVPTAQSLGTMTLDADPDDADWTSELATGSEDTGMSFGRRKLIPHPMAKRIKVSNDFLRQTLTGGEALVRSRLEYKFAVTQEKGFMVGSGANQALGIFTVSNDGIPTSRDVSAGNTTTSPTFDGLLAAKYALKGQYWTDKLRWVFHRDALLKISQLKDNNGQYLWKESVRVGEPDKILNVGLAMSEYCPNTFTTGQYVGALGDFSNYWIADALDVAIKRLDELYAETNQTGFIGRASVDGQPVLAEAFVRVKLG